MNRCRDRGAGRRCTQRRSPRGRPGLRRPPDRERDGGRAIRAGPPSGGMVGRSHRRRLRAGDESESPWSRAPRPRRSPFPSCPARASRTRSRSRPPPDAASARGPAEMPVRPGDVAAVAGAGENVFRTLQTLPGVAAADEFGSRLSVRGGGPDQNLTVMDGVEIHNPYRLFGLTSAFNPETVKSFDLYAGGFSAKYGDRLSSLLVVQNRAGDDTRAFGGSAALSLTDTNVVLEGRLPRGRSSWLVTARRTYYDLFANKIVDTDLPSFSDLQGKVSLDLGSGRRLTFTGLLSRESANSLFDDESNGDQGALLSDASNDVAAATFWSPLGPKVTSSTTLSFYRNVGTFGVDAQFRNDMRRSNAPLDDVGFVQANVLFSQDLTVRDFALRQEVAVQASGATSRRNRRRGPGACARVWSGTSRATAIPPRATARASRAARAFRHSRLVVRLDAGRGLGPGPREPRGEDHDRAGPAARLQRIERADPRLPSPRRHHWPGPRHAPAPGSRPVHPEPRLREADPGRLLHRPHRQRPPRPRQRALEPRAARRSSATSAPGSRCGSRATTRASSG